MANEFVLHGRDQKPMQKLSMWPRSRYEMEWEIDGQARALARTVFRFAAAQVPNEIGELLTTHRLTRGLKFTEGWPEITTPLPPLEVSVEKNQPGHKTHLVLRGDHKGSRFTACVDARINEVWRGKPLMDVASQARRLAKRDPGALERLDFLMRLIFPPFASPEQQPWCDFDYELLTGVASAVLQANHDGAAFALFIPFEFSPRESTSQSAREQANSARLIEVLCGTPLGDAGYLHGPVKLSHPDYLPDGVQLLVGKVNCYR